MPKMNSNSDRATRAAEFIREKFKHRPTFGIILGTGSGVLASRIEPEVELEYSQIPDFPVSTAIGHKGSLVCGLLAENPVVAMNGRFHLYEGHDVDTSTMGVRVMKELGIEVLFITNASGGLNPKFCSGDIMAISSHIDLMCRVSFDSSAQVSMERPDCRSDIYDSELIAIAQTRARANDFVLHVGTYAGLLGPNYETRAEYRMLRRIGADVAGMSTIPEVYVANKLDMRVIGLSVVTNVAKPDVLAETTGQEVIDAAELAAPRIESIVTSIIHTLDSQD